MNPNHFGGRVLRAVSRARWGILTIALTYAISILVGAVMVHTGNAFALTNRDDLIGRADASDPTLAALRANNRLSAALTDFGGNLFAAVSNTVSGIGVIFPYPIVAYRGWVGGIVSVDDTHASRLADPAEAAYYLTTLILQVIPYSLAGGAGVYLGLAYLRPIFQTGKWSGLPREALRDVLRIYALVVPLFFIASLWEFLVR